MTKDRIQNVSVVDEMKQAYGDYAMAVIIGFGVLVLAGIAVVDEQLHPHQWPRQLRLAH